ncbi:ParB/RepB/Spo0J family partition protein [Burkholderia sp. Ac-20345]|uniref:ParB/RepB/Spo0J family partition protein n=1 Tax=Burkholderia sp. Ac-20345 TaxID=2703891 RepID=UPI00197C2B04|nr:ParB/RepB/Spo0J family partition protein [Burkholderia sp. Ac-20345]MBN3776264.1 ParB/RepB/Spo0J family partition protein [Burkholderia sp. Ac-20345]
MNDKARNQQTRNRLGSALRKGLGSEKGEVDARLDALRLPTAPNGFPAPALTAEIAPYGGRGNTASVNPRIQLPLAELVSNPFNPRTFYSPEEIDALAVKLKRDGQYETIKVTRNHRVPDKYVIVDGEYRFRAKKSLGEEYIAAEILQDLSDQDLYLIANRINKDRTAQTPFDDAVAWTRLIQEGIFADQEALAASLDLSKAQISKTLQLTSLPENLLRRMAECPEIGLAHAYNLKLIYERKGLQDAEHVLERLLAGELTVKRLQEMNQRADAGDTTPRTKSHYSARVQFSSAEGKEIGQLKRFRDGRTELKLTGLSDEQQQVLATRLEAVVREIITASPAEGDQSA